MNVLGLHLSGLNLAIALVVFILVFIVIYWKSNRKARPHDPSAPWVSVFSAEKQYAINKPVSLIGIPDLVGKNRQGELVIVDLKTRRNAKIYLSDKIQLSVYAVLLARSTRHTVSGTGYILVQNTNGRTYLPVKLMTEAEVVELYRRRQHILKVPGDATVTGNRRLCDHCTFNRNECLHSCQT